MSAKCESGEGCHALQARDGLIFTGAAQTVKPCKLILVAIFAEQPSCVARMGNGRERSCKPDSVPTHFDTSERRPFLWELARTSPRTIYPKADGGVNAETAAQCVAAGADVLVAGTAVFGGGRDYASRIAGLRSAAFVSPGAGHERG